MLDYILKDIILSFMLGISCQAFYETIVPKRKWRWKWIGHTLILTFTIGFLILANARIPSYAWQPVRLIAVIAVVAQIYFQISIGKNLILSVLFCVIYWLVSTSFLSVIYLFSDFVDRDILQNIGSMTDTITISILLCPMLLLRHKCKNRIRELFVTSWKKFAVFPFLGIIIITAINIIVWNDNETDKYARLTIVLGFALMNICLFCFMLRTLEKEKEMQKLRLSSERTQNQMDMYHTMQKNYDFQRQRLHDYKNQLTCIQGLLENGQTREAQEYIFRLTGTLKTNMNHINTNHSVVNVVLNQKYQSAYDRNITMTFIINDLSALTMSEEDLVTLLANLTDNAIEACEKLPDPIPDCAHFRKIIQFKMILEDGQLILSVRNPVDKPVRIKDNTVITSKQDTQHHGIGLLNICTVIRKNNGTYVLKCENGWFSFSAMIPLS